LRMKELDSSNGLVCFGFYEAIFVWIWHKLYIVLEQTKLWTDCKFKFIKYSVNNTFKDNMVCTVNE